MAIKDVPVIYAASPILFLPVWWSLWKREKRYSRNVHQTPVVEQLQFLMDLTRLKHWDRSTPETTTAHVPGETDRTGL